MDPHMPPLLDGRVTLVTGAGGGIDQAPALAMALSRWAAT